MIHPAERSDFFSEELTTVADGDGRELDATREKIARQLNVASLQEKKMKFDKFVRIYNNDEVQNIQEKMKFVKYVRKYKTKFKSMPSHSL